MRSKRIDSAVGLVARGATRENQTPGIFRTKEAVYHWPIVANGAQAVNQTRLSGLRNRCIVTMLHGRLVLAAGLEPAASRLQNGRSAKR